MNLESLIHNLVNAVKSQQRGSVLTPLLLLIVILIIFLISAAIIPALQIFLLYILVVWGIIVIGVIIFTLFFFAYFAKEDPNLLRSEKHVETMQRLTIAGSKNNPPRQLSADDGVVGNIE